MSRGLTREFRLVAACCAWPSSSARDGETRTLSVEGIDWATVIGLAARHRVEGLVAAALERCGVRPPEPEAKALGERARGVAQRSLVQAAESMRLQTVLDEAGLANLLLKGAAVEVLAYGSLGRKDAWDIDLMVEPAAVGAAIGVLAHLGYQLSAPSRLRPKQFETYVALARECELRHSASGRTVELHWGLVDGPVLLPGVSVRSPSQQVLAGALSFRTLAREELFAYLCVHGAMHGWARLKWLADVAALISGESDEALGELIVRARELGTGAAPDQALALAGELLSAEFGAKTRAALRTGRTERWLVAAAIRITCGGGVREPREDRVARTITFASQFALCGEWRAAWRQLAYRAVSVQDRVNIPLPPALSFLYPILRGPLWLWRRLSALSPTTSAAKLGP